MARSPDLKRGRRIWSKVGEDEGRVGVAEVERVPDLAAAAVAAARRRRKRTRATEPRLLLLLLVGGGGRRGPGKRTGAAELLLLLLVGVAVLVGVAGEQQMGEGCERLGDMRWVPRPFPSKWAAGKVTLMELVLGGNGVP
jgi:hypothetical protein